MDLARMQHDCNKLSNRVNKLSEPFLRIDLLAQVVKAKQKSKKSMQRKKK
jgi:hypothetical protein